MFLNFQKFQGQKVGWDKLLMLSLEVQLRMIRPMSGLL